MGLARSAEEKPAGLVVDKEARTVTIDAKVAPRKLADPKFEGKIYPIEVVASWEYPKGQKAHETVLTFDVKPSAVHEALTGLGLEAGKPAAAEDQTPSGAEVKIFVELPGDPPRRIPIEKVLTDSKTNKPLPKGVKWLFTGSAKKVDPATNQMVYGADQTGTLISIFPVTDQTVFQSSLTLKEEKFIKLETTPDVLPKEGTAVKLVIQAAK
jgi:hypothetical protein